MQAAEPLTASKGYLEITDEDELTEAKRLLEEFLTFRESSVPLAKSQRRCSDLAFIYATERGFKNNGAVVFVSL